MKDIENENFTFEQFKANLDDSIKHILNDIKTETNPKKKQFFMVLFKHLKDELDSFKDELKQRIYELKQKEFQEENQI
jgi:hypothetical protein